MFARRKQEGSAKMFPERGNGAARTARGRSILAENPTAIKNREIDKYPATATATAEAEAEAETSGVNRSSSNESWAELESWGLQEGELLEFQGWKIGGRPKVTYPLGCGGSGTYPTNIQGVPCGMPRAFHRTTLDGRILHEPPHALVKADPSPSP